MNKQACDSVKIVEAELLGAATRYVAVADWFESRPFDRGKPDRDREAMDAFNHVEEELRAAGRRLLRSLGHREIVLEQALNGMATT
jgi:hypothetical protein